MNFNVESIYIPAKLVIALSFTYTYLNIVRREEIVIYVCLSIYFSLYLLKITLKLT